MVFTSEKSVEFIDGFLLHGTSGRSALGAVAIRDHRW
jgi:hypothetical protein